MYLSRGESIGDTSTSMNTYLLVTAKALLCPMHSITRKETWPLVGEPGHSRSAAR